MESDYKQPPSASCFSQLEPTMDLVIAANDFKFCKVRYRKVTGVAPNTKRGKSSSKLAKERKVLQKGKKESKHQPLATARKVQPKSKKTPMPQPLASSTNDASGTVLLKATPGLKPQPPGSISSQNLPNGRDVNPVSQRIQAPGNLNVDAESTHYGEKAGGSRQPQLTGLPWTKDVYPIGQ